MRVGEEFLGEVDTQGEQSVQTKFFIAGVPLFPMQSFWATGASEDGIEGIPIPLHWRSIGLAYLRGYAWAGVVFGLVFGFMQRRWDATAYGFLALALLSAVLGVASVMRLGRVSGREGVRRDVLHRFTGLYAPPEILPSAKRVEIALQLAKRWKEAHPGVDWKQRVDSGKATANERALLYAMARYQQDPRAESIVVAMGL